MKIILDCVDTRWSAVGYRYDFDFFVLIFARIFLIKNEKLKKKSQKTEKKNTKKKQKILFLGLFFSTS